MALSELAVPAPLASLGAMWFPVADEPTVEVPEAVRGAMCRPSALCPLVPAIVEVFLWIASELMA